MRLVRGSEVSSFLSDRGAWKFRWIDRLIPNKPDGKLFFGDLFHKHMQHLAEEKFNTTAAHDRTHNWLMEQDVSAMDDVFYQEMIDLFSSVSEYYEQTYASQDAENIVPLEAELRFAIPLYEYDPLELLGGRLDFAYEGTIDLLYVKDGKLGFRDYKTVSSIDRYINNAVLDRQISRYWWAITALCKGYGYIWTGDDSGWVPVKQTSLYDLHLKYYDGPSEFIYDIVKKDVPKPPKMLKKGGLSQDKSQKTTYEMYLKAIQENNLNPADYTEILEMLQTKENEFLRRVPVYRQWSECEAAIDDFAKAAREMLQVRREVEEGDLSRIYYNITWDTPTFNAYTPIIKAEVSGENVSMVKAALFKTEEHDPEKDFIEVEDED